MILSRTGLKFAVREGNTVTIKVLAQNPDELIGVKTIRIYSQIARMGRDPYKQTERGILIGALEDARVSLTVNGKTVKHDPPFVVMKANDVTKCFGRQLDKLPETSFFYVSENA